MNQVHMVQNGLNSINVCKKVVARYDPHSNPMWGVITPQHSQKLASMTNIQNVIENETIS